jgi:hypothetical protein
MESDKFILALCLILFVVVGINAVLFSAFRKDGVIRQIELFKTAGNRARKPWQKEDNDLKELADLVNGLRKPEEAAGENPQEQNDAR